MTTKKILQVTGLLTILIAFAVPNCFGSETIAELKAREAQIKKVVKQVMPATVCVTDGVGFGSGVVVSEDGIVLTAGHVLLTEGKELEIIFPEGRRVRAKRLGKNLDVDAGMAKIIDDGPFPFVELGKTGEVKKGDWLIAMGHPGGYELGRTPPVRTGRVLQTNDKRIVSDCALIGGDSGGPLFDINGKLVGINSSIGSSIAENRHVAVDNFTKDWQRLAAGKSWGSLNKLASARRPTQGYLGVMLDLQADRALVKEVRSNTAAEVAGMKAGDIVTSLDGTPIRNSRMLINLLGRTKAGERVRMEVLRNGATVALSVKLGRKTE